MANDRRYTTVKKLIAGGNLSSFQEIFDTVPKTGVARDLGMNNTRLTKLVNNPGLFWIRDIYRLADFIEIDALFLLRLIDEELKKEKEVNSRGKK